MAHDIILLIAHYGLLLVFFNVLIQQAGVPVPAMPTLIVAGTLTASNQLPLAGVLLVAVLACLLGDLLWFFAGRRFGGGVMRTICRISLSPDSCVKQSELRFQRWRGGVLLIAKFVPGLSTVAPPLVGAMGLRVSTFLLLDGLGSLLWVGVAVVLGRVFAAEVDQLLTLLTNAGTLALELLPALLALYIVIKWWQRHRLLASLRMARITVEQLNKAIARPQPPVILDVRSDAARLLDNRIIPGALLTDLNSLKQTVGQLPVERELVIYCSCPHEVSAATAAKQLMASGYRHVRPLAGGLEAWYDAGYQTGHLPPSAAAHTEAVVRP